MWVRKNPMFLYTMRSNWLQTVEVEKDLGVMISSDLKCSQQCKYAYTKASRVIGMIRRTISYKEPTRHWLDHMWSTARVFGIHIIVKIRYCWKGFSTDTQR